MKRIFSLLLVMALVITLGGCGKDEVFCRLTTSTAAEEHQWVLGKADSAHWTFMFTEEVDRGGDYDIARIRPSRSAGTVDGQEQWIPDLWDVDEGAVPWRQALDAAGVGATLCPWQASAVVAFQAPQDANYRLDISYTAGNTAPAAADSDGVTVTVYAGATRLYSRAVRDDLLEGETLCVNAMLRAGEYAYIIVDPNRTGEGDVCHSLRVEATQTLTAYVDNETAWAFGQSYLNGDGSQQGVNGWYYAFTDETAAPASYDVSRVAECVFVATGAADAFSGWALGGWLPPAWAAQDDAAATILRWKQNGFGSVCPGTAPPLGASVVVAWEAPATGVYTMDWRMVCGSTADNGDGITATWICHGKTACQKCVDSYEWLTVAAEFSMKEHERCYFVIDPNGSGVSDLAQELDLLIRRQ